MNRSKSWRETLRPVGCLLAVALCCCPARADGISDTYWGDSWHHRVIGSQAAWAVSPGSSDIVVAVVDTGVDATHPDLLGQVVTGWNLFTNSADTSPTYWHGTAVAGVIAAQADNARGVAGVADVSIMPVVVSAGNTMSVPQASAGIRWAVDHGAKVVNLSAAMNHYDEFRSAVRYAMAHDVLVVMGTPNTDTVGGQPAWEDLILVSSSDPDDNRYMSQYANGLDLLAPGVDIYTTYAEPGREGEDRYALGWGTSFAVPIVCGAAALAWSINPDLSACEVREMLFETAVDLHTPGWDMQTGHGRLDLAALALAADATVPEPATATLLLLAAAGLARRKRARRDRLRRPEGSGANSRGRKPPVASPK